MPVRRLIGNAFRLAFGHPLHTLGILLLTLVPIVVTLLFLPRAALFIGLFAVIAFIISWGTWRVIRRYVSPEELATLES